MITWNGKMRKNLVGTRPKALWQLYHRGTDTHDDQASGAISTGQLSAFIYTRVHPQPINVVVFHSPHRDNSSRSELHA